MTPWRMALFVVAVAQPVSLPWEPTLVWVVTCEHTWRDTNGAHELRLPERAWPSEGPARTEARALNAQHVPGRRGCEVTPILLERQP